MGKNEKTDGTDDFLHLLRMHHRDLERYIVALVPFRADADDVLQETTLVLWRRFNDFEKGSNFSAWAYRVALNQVRTWRRRQARDRLKFSETFIETVAEELQPYDNIAKERRQYLKACIDLLNERHRETLRFRYQLGMEISEIAKKTNRTKGAVYRLLSRIRTRLQECVDKKEERT